MLGRFTFDILVQVFKSSKLYLFFFPPFRTPLKDSLNQTSPCQTSSSGLPEAKRSHRIPPA